MGANNWKTNQLVFINSDKLSDHNRSPLQVSPDDLNNRARMADGTMRGHRIAIKRTWTTSWEDLPSKQHSSNGPVDGGLSGEELESLFLNNSRPVTLTIKDGAGNEKVYSVFITGFEHSVKKRGSEVDFWDASITFEEV